MKIELGQNVRSSDGQNLGTIKHLIIDPTNSQVKTLIVGKGLLLPYDVEIPLEAVQEKGGEGLYVDYTAEQVKSLPRFDESLFTPVAPEQAHALLGFPYAGALWPAGSPRQSASAPIAGEEKALTPPAAGLEHVGRQDMESAVISTGDDVFSQDGQKVGVVRRATFDSATGRPTRIIIRQGGLFAEDWELPADAIASVNDGAVHLRLDKTQLQSRENTERFATEWGPSNKPINRSTDVK